jgi:hypothetical protein
MVERSAHEQGAARMTRHRLEVSNVPAAWIVPALLIVFGLSGVLTTVARHTGGRAPAEPERPAEPEIEV